jgi:hypothetical protein
MPEDTATMGIINVEVMTTIHIIMMVGKESSLEDLAGSINEKKSFMKSRGAYRLNEIN